MDFDFDAIGNFGYGTVLTAPSPSTSGVSVELNPGEGDLFPDPSPNPYNVTAYPEATGPLLSNAEIWRVTAKAGDVLTIIRAQEGTSAKAVQVGWQVAMAPTAKVIQDIQNAINAASGVTPGSYTYAQITVDEQGRVTAAANGATPGSVTSVGLAMPSIFSVSGSPVTGAGTLTAALATQASNLVFAGPTTGSANTPTFRSLVAADIPDLSLVYQPLNAKLTAIAALANASGWLKNNGSGTFSYSTPTKSDVGLGNVDNTSDVNKPVSTATQTALDLKADLTLLGAVSGIATLGVDQKLTASQLPSIAITEFLGSVASQAAMLALVGQEGDWCIRTDSGLTYIITGPDPTQLSDWTSLSYPTAPVLSVAGRTGVVVLTSADVGLGNVDNTADSAKSFTTAQITSGTFAAARMPAFTGDATSTAGTVALTVVKINGVTMSGLATGILKNTTGTGAPSIAVAADFPTLNQSTTGSAATLTTARAIYGNNFDGSIALTQIIASTFGGTGNGFTKFSGPASTEKTFTLPNSSETLLYAGGALGTPSGGTVTNLTGTASININGTVGATTPNTGAFTTLSATGVASFKESTMTNTLKIGANPDATTYGLVSLNGVMSSNGSVGFSGGGGTDPILYLRSPTSSGAFQFRVNGSAVAEIIATGLNSCAIGATTPSTGAFTTLSSKIAAATNAITLTNASDATAYGIISMNGAFASNTMIGLLGGSGSDPNLYLRSGTSGLFRFSVAGTTIVELAASVSIFSQDVRFGPNAGTASYARFYNATSTNECLVRDAGGSGQSSLQVLPSGLLAATFTTTGIQGAIGATTANTGAFTTVTTTASITTSIPGGGAAMILDASTGTSGTGMLLRFERGASLKWDMGTGISVGSDAFEIYNRVTNVSSFRVTSSNDTITFGGYGAGALTTDASGNITAASDERLKDITGKFKLGVSALRGITPILHKWKKSSGYETKETYAGFSAQNVQKHIPEAVGKMNNAEKHLTLNDRPILATVVNAINEIDRRLEKLEKLALAL